MKIPLENCPVQELSWLKKLKIYSEGQNVSMLMEYNRTQTGDSAEWLEEKQELEILFQFLFQIDKIFRVKKVCDADIQTITYFLDRNNTGIKALAVGNTFDRALGNPCFVTECIGGNSLFFTQVIDS